MIAADSSVVIAALAPWHEAHRDVRSALRGAEVRLPAHAAFETTSALSRMPHGQRVSASVVLDALMRGFPSPWLSLDGDAHRRALERAVDSGVRGGALYDALIAATACAHDATLLSIDRRALPTYEAMGVQLRAL